MAATVNQDWKNQVKEGEYYQINGTKKVLYWDGKEWRKPVKNSAGSYEDGFILPIEKQPVRIKTVTQVRANVIGCL